MESTPDEDESAPLRLTTIEELERLIGERFVGDEDDPTLDGVLLLIVSRRGCFDSRMLKGMVDGGSRENRTFFALPADSPEAFRINNLLFKTSGESSACFSGAANSVANAPC